jgi:hypothetical protein
MITNERCKMQNLTKLARHREKIKIRSESEKRSKRKVTGRNDKGKTQYRETIGKDR